jgi:tetratricopeptide (TPR) repeat protein
MIASRRPYRMVWRVAALAGVPVLIIGAAWFLWCSSPLISKHPGTLDGPVRSELVLPVVAERSTMALLQDEAITVAEQLLARWPDSHEALHVMAMLNVGLRQRGEAERLWRRCIELAPTEPMYYINAAGAALDQGHGELAVETLHQALAAGCEPAGIYHQLAAVLNQLGRLEEAVEALGQVLERYPDSAEDWFFLGQTQSKLSRFAEAEVSLKRAIALAPAPANVFHVLANVCAAQGKHDEAAKYRRQHRGVAEPEPRERSQAASTAQRVESYLSESLRIALLTLDEAATVYTRRGDLDTAETLRLRSLALDPANSGILRELGALYLDQQRWADAQVVVQRLIQLEPGNVSEHLNLAELAMTTGDDPTAEAAFQRVIDLRPDAAIAHYGLARLYLQRQRLREARLAAEEANRWQATTDSLELLAEICQRMGDLPAAHTARERARRSRASEASSAPVLPEPPDHP